MFSSSPLCKTIQHYSTKTMSLYPSKGNPNSDQNKASVHKQGIQIPTRTKTTENDNIQTGNDVSVFNGINCWNINC